MKYLPVLFFIFFTCFSLDAQKTWPAAFDYKLRGDIKTWLMTDEYGNIIRKEAFSSKEEQMSFEQQQSIPQNYKRFQPEMKKAEYEKKYSGSEIAVDTTVKMKFNERMQLIEKESGNIHEWNTFTADGKILTHLITETISETIVGSGVKVRNPKKMMPDYVFSYTKSTILIFKYNHSGVLQEFESYDTDPSKNVRIVYVYDDCGNLIERDQFDRSNATWTWLPEDYLEKFIHTDITSTFSIDSYYENYWCNGTPVKEVWKYDQHDRKKEYILYNGYLHSPTLQIKWFYNPGGWLEEEAQYDISPNFQRYDIQFDMYGNVVQEIEFDHWDKKYKTYYYRIEYY